MLHALILTSNSRIAEAVESNLDGRVKVHTTADPEAAKRFLYQQVTRLAFFDYQLMLQAQPDALVHIDNVLQQEHGIGVLLCRKATPEAVEFRDRFSSIRIAIDLSRGREQFDEKVRAAFAQIKVQEDASISTDRLIRAEIDLPAPDRGTLTEFPIARLLYTIWQRRESGTLKLKYSTRELTFGFRQGELSMGPDYDASDELLGAFAWSHGEYAFDPGDISGGTTVPVMPLIAEGCKDHTRQRSITETMTPVMRRYPVPTNLWSDRAGEFANYPILHEVMGALDGETTWEAALSALGQRVTEGFRAAYFALQVDLAHTTPASGLIGAAVQYSRSVRKAREAVAKAEVEQTKAFKASGSGRSEIERELGVQLSRMRSMTPHEVFGVWEGCGRKVVQDRFYILVKEHHPDVYGGNTSGNVRSLAQDIFILIKDSYQTLLGIEKDQTVAEPAAPTQQPGRQRLDTPRLSSSVAAVSPSSGPQSEAEEEPVDVRAKLSQLSGFRKKQRHRQRVSSLHGTSTASDASAERPVIETPPSEPEVESEPQVDPEEERQSERQAKLDHLLRRAQAAGHPDANPARDAWDRGFHAHKDGRNREALTEFAKAYELEPSNAAYMTFYAYLRFLNDPQTAAESETMLREALQSGNRQAAPDACLFLAHTIKAQGREDEALTFYKRTLRLNPSSRDAEREVRLAEMRNPRKESDPGSLLKNLFKK